jgi:hypothetical protein
MHEIRTVFKQAIEIIRNDDLAKWPDTVLESTSTHFVMTGAYFRACQWSWDALRSIRVVRAGMSDGER